jgi:hypothetical protein
MSPDPLAFRGDRLALNPRRGHCISSASGDTCVKPKLDRIFLVAGSRRWNVELIPPREERASPN